MGKTLPLLALLLSLGAFAQTTTTYAAGTGTVSSGNAVLAHLNEQTPVPGGYFDSPYAMGAGCYYGGCPDWQFHNYPFSYQLPDGTTASFTNFSGFANFTNESAVTVSGTASGTNSKGASVSISVSWVWGASCRSGRGGGCRKVFRGGNLSVTVQ